ncbi:hypothetical protein [Virgibacillus salexigens]|uniref:DUF948 domain-containing protein n=1 Tax=Virgibacillus kapii TaxID=1638645 RepID=A0ABQ2D9X3_9BACI|nr:hypothetical protein [Virgibacillus kapii]GGJ50859.1 hypothetical protein GCM10007111_11470 [Virgibacillus kapii]
MIELGVLVSIVSVIIAAFAALIGYQTYQLKKANSAKSETRDEAEQSAEVRAALVYIREGVDDIRIDLKANEKNISDLNERVTRVEESTKQAHKRIDTVKGQS